MRAHRSRENCGKDQPDKPGWHVLKNERREDRVWRSEGLSAEQHEQTDSDKQEQGELSEDNESTSDDRLLRIAQAACREQTLHDQLIRSMRGHGQERTTDQSGEQRVRLVEAQVCVESFELSGGSGDRQYVRPTSVNRLAEQENRGDAAENVDARLE